MAEAVVDELEPVEVDEQHADGSSVALGQADRQAQAVLGEHAVGKAGERIAGDEVVEPGVGLAQRDLLARVGEERDQQRLAVVGDVGLADVDPTAGAEIDESLGEAGGEPVAHLLHRPPGDGRGRRVPRDETAGGVVHRQAVAHALDDLIGDREE